MYVRNVMTLKILSLALIVHCACEVQSQGDDKAFPFIYNATEVQGAEGGAICPTDQLRSETVDNITGIVYTRLHDDIVPQLRLEANCPCISGGRRIAYLDMADPDHECPSAWEETTARGVRLCAKIPNLTASCDSVIFANNGGNYSRVCGRVKGYQYCTTDAFSHLAAPLESFYLDGVSITHGNPKQHVWSFAAGFHEGDTSQSGCPCISNPNEANPLVPVFVGNDYFCDTGLSEAMSPPCGDLSDGFLVNDPLWDEGRCGPNGACCENNNPPWFCTALQQTTTDDIEVRICADDDLADESIAVGLIEIYVN